MKQLPAIVVAVALCAGGCRTARVVDTLVTKPDVPTRPTVAASPHEVATPISTGVQTASAQMATDATNIPAQNVSRATPQNPSPNEAYAQAMVQLDELKRQDPAAADQLWKQLQGVKPSLWPLAVQHFKASYEYHRELNGQSAPSSAPPAAYPQSAPIEMVTPQVPVHSHSSQTEPPREAELPPRMQTRHASHAAKPVDATPELQKSSWQDVRQQVLQASYEPTNSTIDSSVSVNPRKHEAETERLDWRESVDSAITQLAATTVDDPRTRNEAYLIARLRLLQLVAGDKAAAVENVPGLTPTEQSYWSGQMMAISTLLDPPNSTPAEARVSLASHHLEKAAKQLSELADLEVRNLVFCKEVYGFGEYDALPANKFRAGDEVRLYFEIDNYRSEATVDGHRTSIDCSYEVLDAAGNRVEGAESAAVEDHCKSRRRDFFANYTLTLPERIYPGKYQLKLTLHDRLADKLGSQTIDFEIVDDKTARR